MSEQPGTLWLDVIAWFIYSFAIAVPIFIFEQYRAKAARFGKLRQRGTQVTGTIITKRTEARYVCPSIGGRRSGSQRVNMNEDDSEVEKAHHPANIRYFFTCEYSSSDGSTIVKQFKTLESLWSATMEGASIKIICLDQNTKVTLGEARRGEIQDARFAELETTLDAGPYVNKTNMVCGLLLLIILNTVLLTVVPWSWSPYVGWTVGIIGAACLIRRRRRTKNDYFYMGEVMNEEDPNRMSVEFPVGDLKLSVPSDNEGSIRTPIPIHRRISMTSKSEDSPISRIPEYHPTHLSTHGIDRDSDTCSDMTSMTDIPDTSGCSNGYGDIREMEASVSSEGPAGKDDFEEIPLHSIHIVGPDSEDDDGFYADVSVEKDQKKLDYGCALDQDDVYGSDNSRSDHSISDPDMYGSDPETRLQDEAQY